MASKRRQGLSLIEILIASVILAIAGIGIMTIFSTSTNTIGRTDARREYRFYLSEILAHVNRQSLHKLFFHYGPTGQRAELNSGMIESRNLGEVAVLDADGKIVNPEDEMTNPLGFTQAFVTLMHTEGLRAEITFEFLRRKDDLNIQDGKKIDIAVGIRHMQAGMATVDLFQEVTYADGSSESKPVASIAQPIMCPAIVGRPGLKLSSCPAVAPAVKCAYLPILQAIESDFSLPPNFEADCQTNHPGVTPKSVTLDAAATGS